MLECEIALRAHEDGHVARGTDPVFLKRGFVLEMQEKWREHEAQHLELGADAQQARLTSTVFSRFSSVLMPRRGSIR